MFKFEPIGSPYILKEPCSSSRRSLRTRRRVRCPVMLPEYLFGCGILYKQWVLVPGSPASPRYPSAAMLRPMLVAAARRSVPNSITARLPSHGTSSPPTHPDSHSIYHILSYLTRCSTQPHFICLTPTFLRSFTVLGNGAASIGFPSQVVRQDCLVGAHTFHKGINLSLP